jgi:hypothetical protein
MAALLRSLAGLIAVGLALLAFVHGDVLLEVLLPRIYE